MALTIEHLHGAALITGATGLLGSHIAEQLRNRGVPVVALTRPDSDTSFLKEIGVRCAQGDLSDPASIARAMKGIDTVYHAAARVGDWGPWDEFVRFTIDGTRNVLDAARAAGVRRFVHVSSISAYGHVNEPGRVLDESAPLGRSVGRWSYYTRAKVEAERIVWQAHASGGLTVSVIRPSWLYGPRDRATLARLITAIRRRKAKLLGDGENRLNVVHAANVAEACILAACSERAAGQAYNVCHDGVLTQRRYFNAVAAALGEPQITASVPYGIAYRAAFLMECAGHLLRSRKPPLVTRYSVWLMGRRCFFECHKIKEQLGWSSSIGYEEGIPAAVEDCLSRMDAPGARAEKRAPADVAA
ncbi:MAG: NAD-dependent epimerase/dehydratase family protein [Phycisphaerales bacterium]|nr:MAG: NAD-dependent epimerase/dehydratase family protein [Phycisphaerales bacterium]